MLTPLHGISLVAGVKRGGGRSIGLGIRRGKDKRPQGVGRAPDARIGFGYHLNGHCGTPHQARPAEGWQGLSARSEAAGVAPHAPLALFGEQISLSVGNGVGFLSAVLAAARTGALIARAGSAVQALRLSYEITMGQVSMQTLHSGKISWIGLDDAAAEARERRR
jgi:hypothetical protein